MSEAEPIVLDHSAWTQQELILHIIHRYFDLGNDVMAGQAWDCLLYTSPSPRDATLSRMPSSA